MTYNINPICSTQTNYKKKFVKEKGKSNYSIMLEPPEVKHAMEVAKKQSIVSLSCIYIKQTAHMTIFN